MRLWIAGVTAVAVIAIAVIVVIAIGSDDGEDQANAMPAPPDAAAMQAFRKCMSENGAELPEAPGGGIMIEPDERSRKAMEECQELMPARPPGAPDLAPLPQN
jgi:hypothetical protein